MSSHAARAGVLNAVALSLMAAVGALTLLLAVPRLAEGLLSLSGNAIMANAPHRAIGAGRQ